jgi:hypothetical protein
VSDSVSSHSAVSFFTRQRSFNNQSTLSLQLDSGNRWSHSSLLARCISTQEHRGCSVAGALWLSSGLQQRNDRWCPGKHDTSACNYTCVKASSIGPCMASIHTYKAGFGVPKWSISFHANHFPFALLALEMLQMVVNKIAVSTVYLMCSDISRIKVALALHYK